MTFTAEEQREIVDRQVRDWVVEIERLASQIAAVKGNACAVVMITPRDERYEGRATELIVEDALRVLNHGWPEGFDVDVLNPSS